MNEFIRLKLGTDLDNETIAKLAQVDVAHVILFEMGVGYIDFNTTMTICEILGASFFDMFPSLEYLQEASETEDGDEDDDLMVAIFDDPANSAALIANNIDPDLQSWFVHIHLKSGNDRRYKLSSVEKTKLMAMVEGASDTSGYFVFFADCQTVIVKRSSVSNVRFTNSLSYAPFSSDEQGECLTLVCANAPRPIQTGVVPDLPAPEGHGTPFADLINAAREGTPLSPFIRLTEGEDSRFIGIDEVDVFEIPIGITVPGFYEEPDLEALLTAPDVDLENLPAQGRA